MRKMMSTASTVDRMCPHLLIGDSHDGERHLTGGADVVKRLRVSKYEPLTTAEQLRDVGPELAEEFYSRRVLYCDPQHWFVVYAVADMRDHEVMKALLDAYGRD
jgi:hypothetical protein